jgi:hypothetical protein
MKILSLTLIALLGAACGSDGIDSDEEARRAYFGLDGSIEKSLTLGFAGFNAANSANIDPQNAVGDSAGTLTITGQVDQGASNNKGMRLHVGMVDYTDGEVTIVQEDKDDVTVDITYNTNADVAMQPALDLSLKGIPTGTFSGTLIGSYVLTGDIDGTVDLALTFSGTLIQVTGGTARAPGMTTVTGTAKSGDGTFDVNLTL